MGAQLRKWILIPARSVSLSRNYIYKQRMFLVQSNLFLLSFFFFFFYCILLSSPRSPIIFPSFSHSLFLFLLENNIYIYIFFLSRISLFPPSSARIEPYHSLTIIFVYAVSRRGYTLMKKGLFHYQLAAVTQSQQSLC